MGYLEIIALALKFLMELWKSAQKTPEQIKLEAIAKITKDMNDDIETFDKALADNNGNQLAAQFELLRQRAAQSAGSNSIRPNDNPIIK